MPRINNEKFYKSAIIKHGQTAKGLNWNSKDNQEIRFKIILELLPKNLNEISLADAGCGFGDFYTYIKKNSKISSVNYLGIDAISEICAIARKQTEAKIIMCDITQDVLPTKDYYICSGALNILTLFETYQFIKNCYKSSKKAFIFNALYSQTESETYNYLTKEKIEKIAKGLSVKKIIFKDGYLEKDITVCFYKA